MKYYLGYYGSNGYVPIKDKDIGDSIQQIVEYTTSFSNIQSIKEELCRKKLLPDPKFRIDYIIEKGPEKNRDYHKVNSTDKIYTLDSKKFFDIRLLKEVLDEEANNIDFVARLNSNYIKKYGYLNSIVSYLYDLYAESLFEIIQKLKQIALSKTALDRLEKVEKYITEHKTSVNYEILDGYLDSFLRAIRSNYYDITNLYIFFKRYIDFKPIPAMQKLSQWLQINIDEDRTGEGMFMDSPYDLVNKNGVINAFFNEIVYDFDYTLKMYKQENGQRKVNYRNLFDLAVCVEEYFRELYEEYINAEIRTQPPKEDQTSYDYYDKEEFLEEEDFRRIGTTSEEAGYNLRREG